MQSMCSLGGHVSKRVDRKRQYIQPIPGARPTGRFASAPIRNDEIAETPAVACRSDLKVSSHDENCRTRERTVIRSLLISSLQRLYSALIEQIGSSTVPLHMQVPPVCARIMAFTEMMYT